MKPGIMVFPSRLTNVVFGEECFSLAVFQLPAKMILEPATATASTYYGSQPAMVRMLPFVQIVSARWLSTSAAATEIRLMKAMVYRVFIRNNCNKDIKDCYNLFEFKMQEADNISKSRLQYNDLLMKGYSSFQANEIPKALTYYKEAFELNPQSLHGCLVKSILGVLFMHTCNYSEAINTFLEGLSMCEKIKQNKHDKANYQALAIEIKLNANLALCQLISGQYTRAKENVTMCLKIIRSNSKNWWKDLFESLVYIFFRFTSFNSIKTASFQSAECKYDDVTQACFYSTMAINKELCENSEQAFQFQKRAFEIWSSRREYSFVLVSLRQLLSLANQLKMSKAVINEYERELQKIMQNDQLQGISEKTLFKGYQQKMKIAKEITLMLMDFQNKQLPSLKQQQVQVKGWKIATRLKLLKAINYSKVLLNDRYCDQRQELSIGVEQMQQTLRTLESQNNILILRNLQKSKFVIESVQYLKEQIEVIEKFITAKKKQDARYVLHIWFDVNNGYTRKQNQILNQTKSKINSSNSIRNEQVDKSDIFTSGSTIKMKLPTSSYIEDEQGDPFRRKIQVSSKTERPPAPAKQNSQINKPSNNSNQQSIKPTNKGLTRPPNINIEEDIERKPIKSKITQKYNCITNKQEPFVQNPNKPPRSVSPIPKNKEYSQQLTPKSKFNQMSFICPSVTDSQLNKKITKKLKLCQIGQYLMKRNFTSNGGDEKFIKITKKQIRWASEESKIDKQGKYQQYILTDVKGLVYGKVTNTMIKSCNKELEPWKCFSLVMKKRTFDLYCPEEGDIDTWVTGVSAALVRATGKQIILYRPGQQLWRKMFLILNHYFIDPQNRHDRRIAVPFAVALKRFIQNGCRLPRKKK